MSNNLDSIKLFFKETDHQRILSSAPASSTMPLSILLILSIAIPPSSDIKVFGGVSKWRQTPTELGLTVFNFPLALLLTPLHHGTLDLGNSLALERTTCSWLDTFSDMDPCRRTLGISVRTILLNWPPILAPRPLSPRLQ